VMVNVKFLRAGSWRGRAAAGIFVSAGGMGSEARTAEVDWAAVLESVAGR